MSIETLAGAFPCPECDRVFPSANSLQGHVMHHGRPPAQKVPCPECGEMYFSGTGMSQHRKAKHGVRSPNAIAVEARAQLAPVPAKRGRKNRVDLDWTTDDIFSTVITALWPGGNIPVDAILPLIQWRETTREFLEKVRSE
jgi:hypothetical protein